MPAVTVLVPGIMGSELRLGNELIWPGPFVNLLLPYRQMDKLLDPNLTATDVIRRYAFSTQYQALINDLDTLGFREKDHTLFVFPYDWRKANELAAAGLADLLDRVVEFQGINAEISLVAHSMGGLVSRYYLESGKFSDRPGFARVRRLLTLGTPHRGAPLALIRILGQEKVLWLSADQVRVAANDPRYPAVYQLLPPPAEVFAWNDAPAADLAGLNPYDPEVRRALGLSDSNAESARAFYAALDLARRPGHVRYFCFSGTQQTTIAFAAFTPDGAGYRVRRVERDSGGDGTVPFWSSTLPGIQSLAVGGEHSVIYKDRELRRTLAYLLGRAGQLGPLPFDLAGPPPPDFDVTVRDRVVEPGRAVRLVLTPRHGVARIDGEVRVERAVDPAQETTAFAPHGPPLRVEYQGPLAESIGLLVQAPQEPGGYRLAYYQRGEEIESGSDDLFVQQTTRAPSSSLLVTG
jgi:hypothetical protein